MSSANSVAYTSSTNLVPVQAEFNSAGVCVGLVGPGGAYFSPPLTNDTITGATIDDSIIGGTTPAAVTGTDVYASEEIGYNATAQGTVTQATSKATGVTLNKSAGQITMNNASLAAGTTVLFTLTNSTLSAKDVLIVNVGSGGTSGAYWPYVANVGAGSAIIGVYNNTASPLAEAIVINYAVIHGA
jgi:hypothetical protein